MSRRSQARFGEFPYCNEPPTVEEVYKIRVDLCLHRLELLEERLCKLERGISKLQYRLEASKWR